MKNIVIIGGGFAGQSAANALARARALPATHRVVLVDANAFAVHLPGVVRALVVPGAEARSLTAALDSRTVFPAGSRHVVVHARVLALALGRVRLDRAWDGGDEVAFERCIVATGAWQAPPLRPALGATRAEYEGALRASQAAFADAAHVLVVGGGAAGVELAGELSTHYPGKRITLVHAHGRLLATRGAYDVPAWVSERVHAQLCARGVRVRLGERVLPPAPAGPGPAGPAGRGVRADADVVFWAVGGAPRTSLFAPEQLARDGTVPVDGQFRTALPGVYAAGDACSSPAPGRKTAGRAKWEGAACAAALLAHLAGRDAPRRATATAQQAQQADQSILVPLGDGRVTDIPGDGIGAGALDLGRLGVWAAPQWLLRWFARDYFAQRAFATMFTGCDDIGFT